MRSSGNFWERQTSQEQQRLWGELVQRGAFFRDVCELSVSCTIAPAVYLQLAHIAQQAKLPRLALKLRDQGDRLVSVHGLYPIQLISDSKACGSLNESQPARLWELPFAQTMDKLLQAYGLIHKA